MADGEQSAEVAATPPARYVRIHATDVIQFGEQVRDWNFEFTQLTPGNYFADGAIVELDGISLARVSLSHSTLHRGYAPRNMVAMLIPGVGSGPTFAEGQLVEPGHCITLSESPLQEGITQGYYNDVAVGFDLAACRRQLDALNDGSIGVLPGTTIAAPGPDWIDKMLGRVDWLMEAAVKQSASLDEAAIRASLSDHMLAAMVRFDYSPADVDSTTRSARAARRVAVRLARDFISSRLAEPLRLSELCRHARLKVRSLEYGFQEVTGITPIAYIRSLRLNAVRKALMEASARHRSISEIAMDSGFWHLSQFATDYRRFYGETPSQTRRRSSTGPAAPSRTGS